MDGQRGFCLITPIPLEIDVSELIQIETAGYQPGQPVSIPAKLSLQPIRGMKAILSDYEKNSIYQALKEAFEEQEIAFRQLENARAALKPDGLYIKRLLDHVHAAREKLRKNIRNIKWKQCSDYRYEDASPKELWHFDCQSGKAGQFLRPLEQCLHCVYFNAEYHPHFLARGPRTDEELQAALQFALHEMGNTGTIQ